MKSKSPAQCTPERIVITSDDLLNEEVVSSKLWAIIESLVPEDLMMSAMEISFVPADVEVRIRVCDHGSCDHR